MVKRNLNASLLTPHCKGCLTFPNGLHTTNLLFVCKSGSSDWECHLRCVFNHFLLKHSPVAALNPQHFPAKMATAILQLCMLGNEYSQRVGFGVRSSTLYQQWWHPLMPLPYLGIEWKAYRPTRGKNGTEDLITSVFLYSPSPSTMCFFFLL